MSPDRVSYAKSTLSEIHRQTYAFGSIIGKSEASIRTLLEVLEPIANLHKEKYGEDDHGPYIICDYDKTPWPCLHRRILNGELS